MNSSTINHAVLFQFCKFASMGAIGTIAQYCLLWTGVEVWFWPASLSSATGYLVGSIINYGLNYYVTFNSNQAHGKTMPRFYLVVLVGWSINTGIMWVLADQLLWNYWIAQLIATAAGLLWNFVGSRKWVFKIKSIKHTANVK